jgi:hypothetical protein
VQEALRVSSVEGEARPTEASLEDVFVAATLPQASSRDAA